MNKRDVLAGMRCPRLLWWSVHEPGAAELAPDEVVQDRFAEGQAVGSAARERLPGREYETSFEADGIAVRTDILERRGGDRAIIEVKASRHVKEEQIDDVAVQWHVLERAGAPVVAAELMHLEADCRAPDLSNLFAREDVTARVRQRLPSIGEAIADARRAIEGHLPEVPIGPQCGRGKEDECPFVARCWKDVPEDHVSSLYYIGKKWVEFVALGWTTIHQLPEHVKLPKPATHRQVRAVKSGRRIVEPGLAAVLAEWKRPVAFLDFETISTAIPALAGASPWEQVPAQFSVHRDDGSSAAWITESETDPRPALAEALVDACRDAKTIVAYFATFERSCLRHLGATVPALALALRSLETRLVDALPVVRDHVYDPRFGGGFSLKRVQPALVGEIPGYDRLEVQEGQSASVRLKRLARGEPADPEERAGIRRALLEYCAFDTFGLMRLVERLRELGSA